jgi:threonine/homoserine/homoserine lactone efflux protein
MADGISMLFVVTSLVLIVTPGQDMILVMSRSIAQGWRAGVATAAGVSTGLMGHTLLAALGLGAILTTSTLLFTVIKLVGAAYLVYLGIKVIASHRTGLQIERMPPAALHRLFLQGAISNIANPKITIFYFAYLPQFIPPGHTRPMAMLLLLGTVFAALTFVVKGPIGYGAGRLSVWLRRRPSVLRWINRASGGILVGLGLKLAMAPRS